MNTYKLIQKVFYCTLFSILLISPVWAVKHHPTHRLQKKIHRVIYTRHHVIKKTRHFSRLQQKVSKKISFIQTSPIPASMEQLIQDMDKSIQQRIRTEGMPGAAVAIVYQGRIIFLKGYGLRKIGSSAKINADTVFQLGSISKPISATLIARLQKEGRLSIWDTVKNSIRLKLKQGQEANLKIWHLLSHTSGLPRHGFNKEIEAHYSRERILNSLAKETPQYSVGQHFDYHNVVFSLVGDVIAAKTNHSFSQELEKEILLPLSMYDTSSSYEALITNPNHAWPHAPIGSRRYGPYKSFSNAYYTAARPAAGINSSARDMATFLKLQMGYYPFLLSRMDLMTFQKPYTHTAEGSHFRHYQSKGAIKTYYGLGWRLVDLGNERIVFHGGWLKGFTNFIGFIPKYQIGIIVLHNAESKFSKATAMNFFNKFLAMKKKQPVSTCYSELGPN